MQVSQISNLKIIQQFLMTSFLSISASTAESQSHLNLTEHIEPSNVKSVIFNNTREISIRFQFTNSEWSRYRGFVLTIQPLGIKMEITFNIYISLVSNGITNQRQFTGIFVQSKSASTIW